MNAAWYTVATEINPGNGWRPLHDPVIQVTDQDPQELIEDTVRDYGLEDIDGQWIIRVYEGYGRFETVVREARS